MNKTTKFFGALFVAALLLLGLLSVMSDNRPFAYAAPSKVPLWAVTPVGVENPVTGKTGPLIPLVTAALTADGRRCLDTREYNQLDVQTVVEWNSTPDTLTLKIEHSNDQANYVDGPVIAATIVANNDYLNRYDTYGAYTCINWDVANASATTYPVVKVLALPKQ